MTKVKHTVTVDEAGTRVDQLVSELMNVSRNQVQHAIKAGRIKLNSEPIKKTGVKLSEGDQITGVIDQKTHDLNPEEIPLEILAENKDYIVINKDADMVVHPDETGHASGTLVNALLAHSQLSEGSSDMRPGIVHRLDKDTSGVIIVAKNNKTHERLAKAFHDREVKKIYLALVLGVPKSSSGTISAPLRRSTKHRTQMAIHDQGKTAVTHFEVEEVYEGASLLKVEIETGRTHQIRVHLASIGHPVLGDEIYGDHEANSVFMKKTGLKRQFLHAYELSIEGKRFQAPLKKDLLEVLSVLRD